MSDYRVKFEVFEGPLDLLLYLIKKEEVDIYEVNLTKLATQFIEYIELMRMLDLEVAGEFLVMAATLMYIKSRELLPKDQQVTPEGEEDEEDPRWELIRQLVEYKKFKDAAAQLQQLEIARENTFVRTPAHIELEAPAPRRGEVSIFDLLNAVNAVLKRFAERQQATDIHDDPWTVSQKIDYLHQRLKETPVLRFSELFAAALTRAEVIVTFLALLELVRLRAVLVTQTEDFGEIEITRAPEPTPLEEAQELKAKAEELAVAPDTPLPRPVTATHSADAPTVVVKVQPPEAPGTEAPASAPPNHS
ncbi:segregation/condensation protein A [Fontisphaera persica]|uniref:segregation and condensation protein A n=1 Tax=Fontisphaera persica TaxID=2974023 RepID=UPI0024BFB95F|nr:segregation/condensation protein A [Fontisphaera persica]WCJ59908.1 segregation/condensation protein A [Fontisphaera persica]